MVLPLAGHSVVYPEYPGRAPLYDELLAAEGLSQANLKRADE